MEYGAHLPLVSFSGESWDVARLRDYALTARSLGFRYATVNDHFTWSRPWLDALSALTLVIPDSCDVRLVTSVALPVLRGPVVFARAAAAIDLLSEGRLILGVGPGSSQRDYDLVGIPFEERWARLDESVKALRSLLDPGAQQFRGRFYSTEGITLEPGSAQSGGPPIWSGSWGSDAGLRRAARLGDGWLASAYNTTPATFREALGKLRGMLKERERDVDKFPNGISTAWMYVTDDERDSERVLQRVLAPAIKRSPDELRHRTLIGTPERCAEWLRAYAGAGAQRIFVWPLADDLRQLEVFAKRVVPLVSN
jgi:alkanesulfonate monooxygenase SsuD/methylene tetrahydromethanopterin reductase-like flavin-dependent oxidoreductase (luciferase family)